MQTFSYTFRHKNGWGSSAVGDFPPVTHCHECGAAIPAKEPGAITSGYGHGSGVIVGATRTGEQIEQSPAVCYTCCHAHDVEQLRDTSRPFGVYVSGDGKNITNWPGAALMRVTSESSGRAGFGGQMRYYRAVDVHGRQWHGKGSGRGMYIAMRACNARMQSVV